jgi:sulfatase modifying factor 1
MRRLLSSTLATLLLACSAAPAEPVQPPPAPTPPPPPAATVTPAPIATATAPVTARPEAPPAPSACPAGMKLVDGDYCSEVEHKCLKSWYDKSNKKTVCEEFEPRSACVGSKEHRRYCIDEFEWPNVKGERPEVMNRFHQAEVKCAAVGKRLCTESEWTLACEGPRMLPFPHGYVRDAAKCNGDHPWDGPDMKKVAKRDPGELARLWRGVRSGSQPNCVSEYGVADLPANADEVVASEQFSGRHNLYDSVHSGGPWYRGVRNQCRPKIYTHDEDFYYYFLSFRCCAEPDGKPTDPRTPKQIKDKWSFEKVERRAQFTIVDMQKKLELKKQGKCECAAQDILCKTMCGTLLGPGAQDATH